MPERWAKSGIRVLLAAGAMLACGRIARSEKPSAPGIVQKVTFQGAKHLKQAELTRITGVQVGKPFDPMLNLQGCERIVNRYEEMGYLFTHCTLVKGGNAPDTEVIYRIVEGPNGLTVFGRPRRQRCPTESDASRNGIAKEFQALAGTWKIVGGEEDGRTIPRSELYQVPKKLILESDGTGIVLHPLIGRQEIRLVINSAPTPKTISYLYAHDAYGCTPALQCGIYKREGDKLTVCLTPVFDGSRREHRRLTLSRAEAQAEAQGFSTWNTSMGIINPKTDFTTAGNCYSLAIYEKVKAKK